MIINQCVKYIFDSSATLIANDPDIHEAFGSLNQSVMTKKKLIAKNGLLKQMWKMVLKLSSVVIDRNNGIEK